MAEPGVGLAEAIEAVRSELIAAQQQGHGKPISFTVGKVVVELHGEIKTSGGGGAGAKFWVLNVDAKAERSATSTHKVTVELLPKGKEGLSVEVHGESAGPGER